MKKLSVCLFLVWVLTGCSKEPVSENTVANTIAGMESRGELPVLDRSATLAGVDADKNGIRDDIDRLIVAQHKGVEETKAMQQVARAIQYELSGNLKTRDEVRSSDERLGKAMGCVFYRSGKDAGNLLNVIGNSSVNTRIRKLEQDRVDQLASGMVLHSYGSDGCE